MTTTPLSINYSRVTCDIHSSAMSRRQSHNTRAKMHLSYSLNREQTFADVFLFYFMTYFDCLYFTIVSRVSELTDHNSLDHSECHKRQRQLLLSSAWTTVMRWLITALPSRGLCDHNPRLGSVVTTPQTEYTVQYNTEKIFDIISLSAVWICS